MMDDSIGMMTATLGYEGFPISIDFHVDYLGKVKVGEKVRIIAKVVREGKNILHATAEIYNMKGELISTGNSNLFKTTYKPDYVKAVDETIDD
jgi:acyl-coenzyme A thioesterase PaaI-like protein